jgi:hypothetical protein
MALFALASFAQQQNVNTRVYSVFKETSLAAASEAVTIRVPSNTNKSAFILDANLYCSVACVVTVESNGTYSSGTTITPTKGRTSWPASEMLATHSTSISSTTTRASFTLAAGEKLPLDFRGTFLTDAADAITFRTNSITGTFSVLVRYEER